MTSRTWRHGQGFTIVAYDNVIPVHSLGGWSQLSFLIAPRLTFNCSAASRLIAPRFCGTTACDKNQAYAANLMYRLAST